MRWLAERVWVPTGRGCLRRESCTQATSVPSPQPPRQAPATDLVLLVLLSVQRRPRELGWALAVNVHLAGLLAQEQVLLAISAHEQDPPAGIDPEPTEAAQGSLEHHGCCTGQGSKGGQGEPCNQMQVCLPRAWPCLPFRTCSRRQIYEVDTWKWFC